MPRRTRRRVRRFVRSAVIALILALVLCEVGLRVAVSAASTGDPMQAMEARRRSGTMAQYAHSPYWSPEFVDALHQLVQGYETVDENDVPAFRDAALPGYTTHDNQRLTTDQPDHFNRTVWVFGSSSVWGPYVDDAHTITSYLQRDLNATGLRWRVVNKAQLGIEIGLEEYLLRESDIERGDLVIFVDGMPELGNVIDAARKRWQNATPPCFVSSRTPSMIAALWCSSLTMDLIPDYYLQQEQSQIARYWRFSDKARAYATQHGAEYIHFMQPLDLPYPALYLTMARGDTILTVNPDDHFDTLHYDDDGHERIAAQIAGVVTGF